MAEFACKENAHPTIQHKVVEDAKKMNLLFFNNDVDVSCSNCSSTQVQKLISKFVQGRSEDDRIDEMADRLESMGDPETGSEMREMMKELGRASDEDMADEMEEMFESDMEGTLDADNSEESA